MIDPADTRRWIMAGLALGAAPDAVDREEARVDRRLVTLSGPPAEGARIADEHLPPMSASVAPPPRPAREMSSEM